MLKIEISCFLAALLLVCPALAHTQANPTRKHNHHQYRYGAYLVPPPPAYMPNILPELAQSYNQGSVSSPNPYRKYIYSREGWQTPQPLQTRKGVSVWNKSVFCTRPG